MKTENCNFHLPLPNQLYQRLTDEARRSNQPATVVARRALEDWLQQREREALFQAISDYAASHAGSEFDLDDDLEAASIECWLANEKDTA